MSDPPKLAGLESHRVPLLPPACYYIPDFITSEEEAYLLRKVGETPQPKWKTVGSGRRLCYWGGTMSKNSVLLPEPMPDWLSTFPDIVERIDAFLDAAAEAPSGDAKGKDRVLGINQVLVNEYHSGQGISPHEDGPAFRPLVATLSLGAPTILDIHHYVSPTAPSPPMIATEGDSGRAIAAVPLGHVLLMPRSLFILTGSLYSSHLHGIAARERDSFIAPEREEKEAIASDVAAPDQAAAGDEGGADQLPRSTSKAKADANVVANASLLGLDALPRDAFTYERGTRVSLTFRHANKVLKGGAFGLAAGGLRRS
ncbi:hypothetical protein CC85DRAFT_42873 [Cutaneotrichosporon oleaginosum]|uniref:Fe2OG dioxygenase domain-containing protein n=1 Tax=Cutaneotrichosporon oleaginosum TaxID=879819 RepID=A0A0J0XRH2_9TREE|nr:uncharacterized protein CC85DRAFT_42873 [Cutaneotrichosporon oleaginosum]KLT43736.1 hypothetical protein CC85DRAFT_42873 [Cutaneotrichosporon oleaginosum]TXT05153.1 hypothetical protein COLE_06473 [Cutaneotrichosporon oleaginosum]